MLAWRGWPSQQPLTSLTTSPGLFAWSVPCLFVFCRLLCHRLFGQSHVTCQLGRSKATNVVVSDCLLVAMSAVGLVGGEMQCKMFVQNYVVKDRNSSCCSRFCPPCQADDRHEHQGRHMWCATVPEECIKQDTYCTCEGLVVQGNAAAYHML